MNEWLTAYRTFRREVELIAAYLVSAFKKELILQGHKNTGSLENSFEIELKETAQNLILEIYSEKYGVYLSEGISASRIPFSRGSGGSGDASGVSQYIEGLRTWVAEKLGLSGYEALKTAFAIANVQKREGMPTRASFANSQNGERLKWIDRTVQAEMSIIERLANKATDDFVNTVFIQILDNAAQEIRNAS